MKFDQSRIIVNSLMLMIVLGGCASKPSEKFSPEHSYLRGERTINDEDYNDNVNAQDSKQQAETTQKFRFIPPLKLNTKNSKTAEDVLKRFSDEQLVKITADSLPLKDYLHQVLGQQLNVSYVLGDEVNQDAQPVTMNLQESISARKLFALTEELLTKRKYAVRFDDDIFYIHKSAESQTGNIVYGYGKGMDDVPNTSSDIVQLVPFEYGMQVSLGNTLRQLTGVKSIPDQDRNAITIQGKRREIVKALELIQIMDQPRLQNRHIGIYESVFINSKDLIQKLKELLDQEGISLGTGSTTKMALSIVTLNDQGSVILFANNKDIIDRAVYWAEKIDQPITTQEKQYFTYAPKFSRAIDMGESLQALIDSTGGLIGNSTSAATENKKADRRRVTSASSRDMKMVVDERTNSLIFFCTGQDYKQMLPLIRKLDVLPKQVMLEMMIAEVTLTDEFKQGVEFAFSKGNYGFSTQGAFMGEGFGGLSYLLQGANGNVAMNLLQTNSLVNILSKPSLVVRDGVNATITVGTDIPIVGETSSDPLGTNKQTTSIEYRKTGVELSVTPTVNAQGVVLMEIKQKISNEVDAGGTSVISPSVFERSISTEVIAESGQTIVLGGLISSNSNKKESKVPVLGDLPLIGGLFRAKTDGGDKTELVVIVTPKVIESADEWNDIRSKFNQAYKEISFN